MNLARDLSPALVQFSTKCSVRGEVSINQSIDESTNLTSKSIYLVTSRGLLEP